MNALNGETDKVRQLQAALAEAAQEIEDWVDWATSSNATTKGAAARQRKLIARYRAMAKAAIQKDAHHGS